MARYPAKYFVPNAITSASLLLGVGSVLASNAGRVTIAGWFILMCVLLDKLDGTVARRINASSEFGMQLDSFSDFTTFGLAPAMLLAAIINDPIRAPFFADGGWIAALGYATVFFYALAAGLRLAKFNVMSGRVAPGFFLGMPTTLSGALLASLIITSVAHDVPPIVFELLPVLYAVCALLMVSDFHLPKLALPSSQPWRALMILAIGSAYVFGFTWMFPEYLFALALFFTIFGFSYGAAKSGELGLTEAPAGGPSAEAS